MKENAFRYWLLNVRQDMSVGYLDSRTVESRVANCKAVERHEGDLDRQYHHDEFLEFRSRRMKRLFKIE